VLQRRTIAALVFALTMVPLCSAAVKLPSVDTGECGDDTPATETVLKSPQFANEAHTLKAYGEVSFKRVPKGAAKTGCYFVYRLFVADHGKPFAKVKEIEWETEDGEVAGIDLVGLSPNGTKFAADFWLAEGDGQTHQPVVYDFATGRAIDLPLEDRIQKLIYGCDQIEDFVGVTNAGEAVFAIPPSIYDDSPGCGDKGLWHFNLTTGRVYRVARISGVKWR